MNAPWKPGSSNGRDPFNAYICDDNSLDVLRPVVIEMGWQPEKCNKGGLRNAVQSLSITASPNILMVDLSESGDPLSDINALAEVCEPGTVVIAIGQVNDVRLYRDLLASGMAAISSACAIGTAATAPQRKTKRMSALMNASDGVTSEFPGGQSTQPGELHST